MKYVLRRRSVLCAEGKDWVVRKSKSLIFGGISGLLCVFMVFLFVQSVKGEAAEARAEALSRYGGDQIEVYVAKRDISIGEFVDESNADSKLWLVDLLPEDAIGSLADIDKKTTSSPILAGEVISDKRFVEKDKKWTCPPDLSALSVPAKDVQTIGGVLDEGMHVDVYATGATTSLLAQDVLVLATNVKEAGASSSSATSWVTLALSPELVQEVIAASQKMELYFVLPPENNKEEDF